MFGSGQITRAFPDCAELLSMLFPSLLCSGPRSFYRVDDSELNGFLGVQAVVPIDGRFDFFCGFAGITGKLCADFLFRPDD